MVQTSGSFSIAIDFIYGRIKDACFINVVNYNLRCFADRTLVNKCSASDDTNTASFDFMFREFVFGIYAVM